MFGSAWMLTLALTPWALSKAVDEGLRRHNNAATLRWASVLLVASALDAGLSICRHRTMTRVRLDANLRTNRVIVDHVVHLGADLPGRVAAGELATVGVGDIATTSTALTVFGPGVGALVAYVVVAVVLLSISPLIAVVVLIGVPVQAGIVAPQLAKVVGRQDAYRTAQGRVMARLLDLIQGLRVLHAFGGKPAYAERFRQESFELQDAGRRVGAVTSWVDALGTGLPVLFLAAVTWLGARMAVEGTITIGELVAVYGYVAMLAVPVSFFLEGADQVSRALVSARRITAFLRSGPTARVEPDRLAAPHEPAELHDPVSGARLPTGCFVALVSDSGRHATEVVERLSRFVPAEATWGDRLLEAVDINDVRARVLLSPHDAHVFAGTLREAVLGRFVADDEDVCRALRLAAAEDVLRLRSEGLDTRLTERANNLSEGQRQRVRLARALLADAEVLLLVDPTSALDAHTEALVATGLSTARAGRTTLVATTSPPILAAADIVLLLLDGRVVATGAHEALLAEVPRYGELVTRGTEFLEGRRQHD